MLSDSGGNLLVDAVFFLYSYDNLVLVCCGKYFSKIITNSKIWQQKNWQQKLVVSGVLHTEMTHPWNAKFF